MNLNIMFSFKAKPKTIDDKTVMKRRSQNESGLFNKGRLPVKAPNYIQIEPQTGTNTVSHHPNECFYVDKPPEPVYVPLEPKIDKSTQIERRDWLLFDFDREVEPLLQVIVPKVLEQSQIEIIWENATRRQAQEKYKHEVRRNAQIHRTQRQLYKQKRLDEEKANRRRQNELAIKALYDVHRKMHARGMVKKLTNGFIDRNLDMLAAKKLYGVTQESFIHGEMRPFILNGVNANIERAERIKTHIAARKAGFTQDLLNSHSESMKRHAEYLEACRIEEQKRIEEERRQYEENKRLRALRNMSKRKTLKLLELTKQFDKNLKVIKPMNLWNTKIQELLDYPTVNQSPNPYVGLPFNLLFYLVSIIENFSHNFEREIDFVLCDFLKEFKGEFVVPVTAEIMSLIEEPIKKPEDGENQAVTEDVPLEQQIDELIDQMISTPFFSRLILNEFIAERSVRYIYKAIINSKIKSKTQKIEKSDSIEALPFAVDTKYKNSKKSLFDLSFSKYDEKITLKPKNLEIDFFSNQLRAIVVLRPALDSRVRDGIDDDEYAKYEEEQRYEQYYGDQFYKQLAFFYLKEEAEGYRVLNTSATQSFVINSLVRDAIIDVVNPIVAKHIRHIDVDSMKDFVSFWEMKFLDIFIEDKDAVPIYDYSPNK